MDAAYCGIKSVKKPTFPYKGLKYYKIRNFKEKCFEKLEITYFKSNYLSL